MVCQTGRVLKRHEYSKEEDDSGDEIHFAVQFPAPRYKPSFPNYSEGSGQMRGMWNIIETFSDNSFHISASHYQFTD